MHLRLVLVALFLLLGSTTAQQSHSSTRMRIFTPFGPGGLVSDLDVTAEVGGSCFAGSAASPERPDAFRCTAGNAIHDPCFRNPMGDDGTLACATDPFTAKVVVLMLTEDLPSSGVAGDPDFGDVMPWALELENGGRCTMLTGATAPVAGMRINYGCTDGTHVVGPVDRTLPVWRVFHQAEGGGRSLDQVAVRIAWY